MGNSRSLLRSRLQQINDALVRCKHRSSAGPHRVLRPPQLRKLRRAQRRLSCGEELVELRRRDICGAQHRVRLAPVMNLVLKQMKQQPIDPLALNAIAAVDVDDTIEILVVQLLDYGNQSPVYLALRIAEHDCRRARLPVRPGRRSEGAALHGVDVKTIDNQDVVERRAQAWKEAGPRRHEFSLRQPCAGREQTMVGPAVVVGHGTVRKDSTHQRPHNSEGSRRRFFYHGPAAGGAGDKPPRRSSFQLKRKSKRRRGMNRGALYCLGWPWRAFDQLVCWIAESSQLEPRGRAKVQTSVASVGCSLPATRRPVPRSSVLSTSEKRNATLA